MYLKALFKKHTLNFKFNAGTSRGVLTRKDSWFIKIFDPKKADIYGLGEAGPLPGLSIDFIPDFESEIDDVCKRFESRKISLGQNLPDDLISNDLPSLRFAFETALIDLNHGGRRQIFKNDFSEGIKPIPINGLVWMGDKDFMLMQIKEKIDAGFKCIKMKIGSIDFETECSLLKFIRSNYPKEIISLRLDANGAFTEKDVFQKLEKLSNFEIHSIEQPVRQGHPGLMKKVCKESPIDVALDEELIGVHNFEEKRQLLNYISPQKIILKPTLLGGFDSCKEWITAADEIKIEWWFTSALESNIGLNAISQFAAEFSPKLEQGLGTGQLYHNNIESPLSLKGGNLWYDRKKEWETIYI